MSRGKSPQVGSMLVLVGSGRSWQHMETSLVVGTVASSMARRGICFGLLRLGWASQHRFPSGWFCEPLLWSAHVRLRGRGAGSIMASHGNVWSGKLRSVAAGCVRSRKPPTRSAWSRLRCCKVGWIAAERVMSGHAEAVSVRSWKPPSCGHGGRSTRPWWDEVSWCAASRCAERRVVSWSFSQPHPCRHGSRSTREVWDSSGRVLARLVGVGRVELRFGTKLVQARGRINAGGLGCITEWCGGLMLGMSRLGESW